MRFTPHRLEAVRAVVPATKCSKWHHLKVPVSLLALCYPKEIPAGVRRLINKFVIQDEPLRDISVTLVYRMYRPVSFCIAIVSHGDTDIPPKSRTRDYRPFL